MTTERSRMPAVAPGQPPATRPARRVVLWIAPINADYLDALRNEGIKVVAALHNNGIQAVSPLQSVYPDIFWFTVHDLFLGCPRLSAHSQMQAPAAWIDDASYRQYALCVQRVGFHPGSQVMEVLSGGIAAASDLEDWARVHLNHALRLLHAVSADEIWFDTTPHIGVDNMLALAAARTGRPCLVVEQIRFAPKFSCRRIGETRDSLTQALAWKPWTAGAGQPDLSYMRENVGRPWHQGLGERLGSLLRGLAGDWPALSTRAYLGARKRRAWWPMYLLEWLDPHTRVWAAARLRLRRRFDRERKRREHVRTVEALGDFVYFPLHLEPEANVHATGGRYRNQLDAIVDLHQSLPPGWSIVLKENPKQTWMHRGPPFVERLKELPSVRFADEAMPSRELIAHSRLVATITGTAGYESLLAGKPCLYFGEPWYAGLPGVIGFEPGLDLVELSAGRVARDALDAAVNARLSGLADGLAHPRFAGAYMASHDIADLYAQTARSMVAIGAHLQSMECPVAGPDAGAAGR
ncbi:MAG: hypothetical protein QM769_04790 [Pseudoxanthomonas sp.]